MNESLFNAFVTAGVIFLTATVKNPASAKAKRLRKAVVKIHKSATLFLAAVPAETGESGQES